MSELLAPRRMVELEVDGEPVRVFEGATILDACRQLGIDTPTLCYGETLQPANVCRVCVVELEGARVLAPACSRKAEAGMKVRTDSEAQGRILVKAPEAGFLKAKADAKAAEACGLSVDQVKAELCPGAAKREALAFLGRYCLAEAKPLAEKHCAGRDFTALRAGKGTRDKYDDFCMAYLSSASLAQAPRPDAPSTPTANPADAVTDGVTQGINKLRGLFGR